MREIPASRVAVWDESYMVKKAFVTNFYSRVKGFMALTYTYQIGC